MQKDDVISRQAAIDKADMLFKKTKIKTIDFMIIGYNHAVADFIAILKNLPSAQPVNYGSTNLIDKNEVLDAIHKVIFSIIDTKSPLTVIDKQLLSINKAITTKIKELPSAQLERDIPIKPKETRDRAWGIPSRQAVCPKCDYYLGHIAYLDDYKGKRMTYCENCGQAIDWEGWDFDG